MLLQFSVENYKSIKEPTILSFEASADKSFKTHVCTKKNNRILKPYLFLVLMLRGNLIYLGL